MKGFVRASAVSLLFGAVAAPQTHVAHRIPSVPDELLTRTVPLRTGIGRAHDAVATKSPQAQAFYDQGLAYLHSYVWLEAARSFNQALRIDAALARQPSDVELWLLRGIAQSPDPADRGQGSVEASIPFFEKALGLSPDHFA